MKDYKERNISVESGLAFTMTASSNQQNIWINFSNKDLCVDCTETDCPAHIQLGLLVPVLDFLSNPVLSVIGKNNLTTGRSESMITVNCQALDFDEWIMEDCEIS